MIAYFAWKVEWWRNQAHRRDFENATLAEGLQAYAARQVSLLENLADSSIQIWLPALSKEGITPEWATPFKSHVMGAGEPEVCADDGEEVLDDSDVVHGDDRISNELDFEDF